MTETFTKETLMQKMKDIVINFQCRAKSFRINGLSSEIQYIFDWMQDNKTIESNIFHANICWQKTKACIIRLDENKNLASVYLVLC